MGNRTDYCIDLFAFTIYSPAWETAPISASICSPLVRSPAWNRTNFCTSDHLGITHSRKTVSPLRNPCGSDPFWSQLTIDVRLHENQFLYASTIAHGRHLSLSFIYRRALAYCQPFGHNFCTRLRLSMGGIFRSLLYVLLSIGSLEQFWNVITLELRASFSGRKSSRPFFFLMFV